MSTTGKTYYQTLGVDDNATDADIKSAYRKLAKEYHPDANPNDKVAEAKMKEINSAYEAINTSDKRAEYQSKYEQNRKTDKQANTSQSGSQSQTTSREYDKYKNTSGEREYDKYQKTGEEIKFEEKFNQWHEDFKSYDDILGKDTKFYSDFFRNRNNVKDKLSEEKKKAKYEFVDSLIERYKTESENIKQHAKKKGKTFDAESNLSEKKEDLKYMIELGCPSITFSQHVKIKDEAEYPGIPCFGQKSIYMLGEYLAAAKSLGVINNRNVLDQFISFTVVDNKLKQVRQYLREVEQEQQTDLQNDEQEGEEVKPDIA